MFKHLCGKVRIPHYLCRPKSLCLNISSRCEVCVCVCVCVRVCMLWGKRGGMMATIDRLSVIELNVRIMRCF